MNSPPHQPQSSPRAARGRGRGGPRRGRNETTISKQQNRPPPPARCCSVCTTGAPNYKCPKCRAIYCSIACCRAHKQDHCAAAADPKQPEEDGAATEKNENEGSQGAAAAKVRSKYVTVTELQKIWGEKRASNGTTNEVQSAAKRSRMEDDDPHNNNNNRHLAHQYDDLEPGWKVTDEMANGMRNSIWLRQELSDPGLQHLISQVVSASSCVAAPGKKGGHRNNRKPGGSSMSTVPTTPQERLLDDLKYSNPQFKLFLDKLLVTAGVLEVQQDQGSNSNQGFDLNAWLQSASAGAPHQLQLKPLHRRPRPASSSSILSDTNEKDDSDSNSDSEGSSSGDDNSSTSPKDP